MIDYSNAFVFSTSLLAVVSRYGFTFISVKQFQAFPELITLKISLWLIVIPHRKKKSRDILPSHHIFI
jgi:hypothetical protein